MTAATGTPIPQHRYRPGSARAALSYPAFRTMFVGSFASNIGTWMQNVVLPAYVYQRTGKASVVALLVFAQLGPLLILAIPGGVIADRFDRRKWLIAMQAVQLVFSAALAPLAAHNSAIWALFMVQLGVGIGNALNLPAWSAALPTLVNRQDLAGAISLNSTNVNGSRVVGPIIVAGLSVAGVTTAQFFLINAATYLFVIWALLSLRLPRPAAVPHESGRRLLTSGIRLVRASPASSRILLALTTFSLFSLPYVGLFPAIARLNFGIVPKSAVYNWLYATWGLGACLGALAIGTIFVDWDKRRLIRLGFGLFAISMTAFAVSREPIGAFISGFFLGIAYFGTTTSMLTVLQSRLHDHERGRVMSLWFMAFGGTVTIGLLIFGPVVDAIGARWVLFGGAVWAAFLWWWCDVTKIDRSTGHQEGSELVEAGHTAPFDEYGVVAGE
ncbi:MAG: MFS transporter [Ilumatobacteraceae bacterium]